MIVALVEPKTRLTTNKKIIKNSTKIILAKIVFLLTSVIVLFFTIIDIFNQQSTKDRIVGSWFSDVDSNSIWIFSLDGNCKRYYAEKLLNTSDFTITNTSCKNKIDSKDEYLKLIKSTGKNILRCINGITQDGNDIYLSIEFNGNLSPMLFKKQGV
ncbi:hypothetical protein CXF59_12125 [Flavobacterium sp. ALD4]|uniref:hypothetical protein n=1 Tax=Flavobacterium sp. ALD4 TaxID=2058314 RepID=UPI000C34BFAA|nr:hypothetical protein [Flavobacterium sp. ALD4]PKH66668.1 hypothetical protein CXF59_12125 [Flavobacterium sp. ALD4]